MTCEQARSRLTEAARAAALAEVDGEADRHAAECHACRRWREVQRSLTDQLANLATRNVPAPPDGAEAALLAELRPVRRFPRRVAVGLALAAGLALAIFLPRAPDSGLAETTTVASDDSVADFYVLDHAVMAQPLRGSLVRVTLSPEATQFLGLPPLDPSVGGVRADVWLSEDGVPQAVRYIEPVSFGGSN